MVLYILKLMVFFTFPINASFSLWLPVALLQARIVTLSLLHLCPGAKPSTLEARVFEGSIL
jgi:hypothetical protein